jgi:RimJ/RimL family protein N-acetyltransferase
MITVKHGYIRFSEADDALFLRDLYLHAPKRAALLDTRREPLMPAVSEVRDMLARKDAAHGLMYTVEDTTGALKGWCSLRGVNYEAGYGEIMFLFASEEDYHNALADETMEYLLERAFNQFHLYKVLVLCLDMEQALMQYLERKGFSRAGTQRQALFSGGAWHDLHIYTLRSSDYEGQEKEQTAGAISS